MPNLDLTNRELEIVLLAAEGRTDKEIAAMLGIARVTVVTHWSRMRQKLEATNRAQLIAKAMAEFYKEARSEASRLDELYRCMIDVLEDFAVFLLDRDRKVISWNPGVERILGYTEQEWLGRHADDIFTEEDRLIRAPDEEQRQAEATGKAMDERWHQRKDGRKFWSIGVMLAIRGPSDDVICLSKILRDLTRIKRLEERVRSLGGDPEVV